jgi:hypothetical protein
VKSASRLCKTLIQRCAEKQPGTVNTSIRDIKDTAWRVGGNASGLWRGANTPSQRVSEFSLQSGHGFWNLGDNNGALSQLHAITLILRVI